jgi:RNA polymerase sigma factor (sigma-70 family)
LGVVVHVFVHRSSSNRPATATRPRWAWVFTDPTLMLSDAAVSRSALRHRAVVDRHARHERGLAVAHDDGADRAVEAGVRREAVLDALRRLPTRQREVLALRYYLDLSEAEIAATLGISAGAVKSHASRGAATLRTHLATDPEDLR